MDPLSIYCNDIWQDAQRRDRRVVRPNTFSEIAAFARRLSRTPKLFYSVAAKKWETAGPSLPPQN